ncbi:MAG: B12-binding domain-containing radical SAM protein, partial [Candidatus Omnitrophica bacterium]|nr:B12-binding domain-containing radical SAM protein [Candidatus Omnitrophota bacterium]
MSKIALVAMYDEYCLGLRYISSYLQAQGHTTRIFLLKDLARLMKPWGDPNDGGYYHQPCAVSVDEFNLLTEQVRDFDPMLIGISLASNFLGLAERLTQEFRENIGVPIVWGGIEPTINPDYGIQHADFLCVGEGEKSMLELVESLSQGGDGSRIEGLWKRVGDAVTKANPRPNEQDLDSFPFPDFEESNSIIVQDDQVYIGKYPSDSRHAHSIMVISQRGCPYSCTFCCNNVLRDIVGRKHYLRRRSPENFVAEIEERIRSRPNISIVEIEDDVFTLDKNWIQKFCELYKERINLPFWCYTYPKVCTYEMMSMLKDAGLFSTTMGMQSGSERLLADVYGRKTLKTEMIQGAKTIQSLGLDLVVDVIGYHPMENEEDLKETLDVLINLPTPYTIHPINQMSFYGGFKITELAKEAGVELTLAPGTNKYFAEGPKDYDRWAALYYMCQFAEIPRDAIRALAEDQRWHEDPQTLRALADGILRLGNYNGDVYMRKEKKIKQLEDQLAVLTGSRLVRFALALRNKLSRFRRPSKRKKKGGGPGSFVLTTEQPSLPAIPET